MSDSININELTSEQLAEIMLNVDTSTRKEASKIVENTLALSFAQRGEKIYKTKVFIQGGSQGKSPASVRVKLLQELMSDRKTFDYFDVFCEFDKAALKELANSL